jgi:hypothetical protein
MSFSIVIDVHRLVPVPTFLVFRGCVSSRMRLAITLAPMGSIPANISNKIHSIWYRRLRCHGPREGRQVGLPGGSQDRVIGLLSVGLLAVILSEDDGDSLIAHGVLRGNI